MNEGSLTITFTVDRTQDEAFAAITNVRGWWNFYIASSLPSLITNGAAQPGADRCMMTDRPAALPCLAAHTRRGLLVPPRGQPLSLRLRI